MQPHEHDQFLEVLGGVYDFYSKPLSAFAGEVWLQATKGFDLDQVSKAFSAHLMDAERGAFMPKPADIVRQLQGTNTDRSLMAWGKAFHAMSGVGAYSTVCFDDPVIHAVIDDIGGWPKLCQTTNDELPFVQRRFCEAYRAYAGRGADISYPPMLPGIHDQNNAPGGFKSARPVLIGNPEMARQVAKGGTVERVAISAAHRTLELEGRAA